MTTKRTRTVLPGAVFLAALAISSVSNAIEPMADPDYTFGSSQGTAFAAYDLATSTLADRGIAVFADRASSGYVMIGEAASPTAGNVRIAFSFVTAAGAVTSSVKSIDVFRVDTACQRPNGAGFVVGVVEGTESANGIALYAFTGNGTLDTSVFGGDGIISSNVTGPERVIGLICSGSDVLAVQQYTSAATGTPGGITFRAEFAQASTSGGNAFIPDAGGFEAPVGIGKVSSQRVPVVFALKSDTIDNAIKVSTYHDGTMIGLQSTEIPIPFATCGAMSSATSGRATVAKVVGDRILVTGNARVIGTFSYIEYAWLLEINVPASGLPTLGSCTSRRVGENNFTVGTNFFANDLAINADGTEAYVLGTGYYVDPIETDYDFALLRFTKPSANWTVATNDEIAMEFTHGSNILIADDQAIAGFIDARTTPNRLLVAGVRQWSGADTDASLTRLQLAPLFANGLE